MGTGPLKYNSSLLYISADIEVTSILFIPCHVIISGPQCAVSSPILN